MKINPDHDKLETRDFTMSRRDFLSAVAAASLVAACSPSGTTSTGTAGSPTAKVGGTIVVGGPDPGVLENSLNLGSDTNRYVLEIYDRLVQEDLSTPSTSPQLVPGLATSWETSPDGLQVTFKLRQGVMFHDGTPLDAEAVKFNIDRLTQPSHPFYYKQGAGSTAVVFGKVRSTDVIDPSTVRVNLSTPYANFTDALSISTASIASPTNIKKYGNDEQGLHPVGTGPFKFVEHQKGTKLVLEANKNYWGGAPKVDQVINQAISEPAVALSALLAGEIQLGAIAVDSVATLKGNSKFAVFAAEPTTNTVFMYNTQEKPFNDRRVRQALNWAMDRETLTRNLLRGYGTPSKSVFGSAASAYDPSLKGYSYDPDKAKALLAEAGLANGFSFTMPVRSDQPADVQLANYLKDNLARFNIRVDILAQEGATLSAAMNRAGSIGFGGYVNSWFIHPPFNFDRFFTSTFAPPNGVNFGFYKNSEVDAGLADAAKTPDRAARIKIYQKLDAIVTEDAAWLFGYLPKRPIASSTNLQWVVANSVFWTLRNAYFTG